MHPLEEIILRLIKAGEEAWNWIDEDTPRNVSNEFLNAIDEAKNILGPNYEE